ncbi:MAG: phospholipid carrier-dependent glycosyltransferase [Lachnospiraceae bacterium]|nr:phospholipid carrier-dependent glycosyltransferase [Lachnospiraceae bacterium]
MGQSKSWFKREWIVDLVFYLLVFLSICCFAAIQTYGDPPDEINRFKVVSYIAKYGRLPIGSDPEVLLDGYGASYAFQPILTYIIQGFLLRFLGLFTENGYVLLLFARMVNAVFGVLMAYFVRRIARETWKNPYLQWTFTLLVVFLPQNIFIHSYVNTDSMALLAVAIIFYVLLKAQRTGYERQDCILLAVGIILCAMSYYNAYGMILAAIIIFALEFIHRGGKIKGGLWIEWQPLLQKGLFISVIVLAGIGWWFIRNGILYEGDIIAMNARRECAILTATEEFNPLTRFTWQKSGESVWAMLMDTGYLTLLRDSFIAMFGPMLIPTHGLIYLFYQWLWIVACVAAVLPLEKVKTNWQQGRGGWTKSEKSGEVQGEYSMPWARKRMWLFYGSMLLFCVITIGLSIYYSYTWEYQPQGRYVLPILVPFMYLVTQGIGKLSLFFGRLTCLGTMGYVLLTFGYSLFDRFLPYYAKGDNLFSLWGKLLY